MNANGILIQGLNDKTNFINNFDYQGINAFFQFPLTYENDNECRKITNEQQSKKISDNHYISLEFIADNDLYERYIKKCNEMQIDYRILFIESDYTNELWNNDLPKLEFLGYEYCPIPIDEQVVTDMDWYKPFSKYWKHLNQFGLFDSYDRAKEFANEYLNAMKEGTIGDGEMNAYICKVSRVVR